MADPQTCLNALEPPMRTAHEAATRPRDPFEEEV
jgi:hypothetical protein